jgi:outer membrane protein OmpA-like peptidoglycan-associated protein
VKRLVLTLVGVLVLVCTAATHGESRALVPVVRDLQVRVVDPVAAVEPLARGVRLPGDVLFAFDDDQLGTPGRRAVTVAAAILGRRSAGRLTVEGYTDARGKAAYNLRLARRRATTVAAALRAQMSGVRIAVRAYGESRPVASNATAHGRARNRRVEIRATG